MNHEGHKEHKGRICIKAESKGQIVNPLSFFILFFVLFVSFVVHLLLRWQGMRLPDLLYELAVQRQRHGFGAAGNAQLGEDAAHVELDRRARDHQPVGDIVVAHPLH